MAEPDLFAESSIPVLEDSLRAQVAAGTYDGRTVRGLLKLYGMYPARAHKEHVVVALTKALAALPEPDFMLCVYLIAPALQAELPLLPRLVELEELLQASRFTHAWAYIAEHEDLRAHLAGVPGFDDAIRAFILKVVARTYQKIDVATLAAYLNTDAPGTLALSRTHTWSVEGMQVAPPPGPENSVRAVKVVEDPLTFADLSGLVQQLSR